MPYESVFVAPVPSFENSNSEKMEKEEEENRKRRNLLQDQEYKAAIPFPLSMFRRSTTSETQKTIRCPELNSDSDLKKKKIGGNTVVCSCTF